MNNKVNMDIKKLFSNVAGNNKILALMEYNDLLNNKTTIINSNKNKMGIYLWFNNLTKDFYVGSSVNLSRRLLTYFTESYLIHPKNKNMIICKSLIKYSYDNFSLAPRGAKTRGAKAPRALDRARRSRSNEI